MTATVTPLPSIAAPSAEEGKPRGRRGKKAKDAAGETTPAGSAAPAVSAEAPADLEAPFEEAPTDEAPTEGAPVKGRRRRAEPVAGPPPVNTVRLIGRFPVPAEARTLPSGAGLVTFRIVVGRDPDAQPVRPEPDTGRRPPTIDTIDCVAWDEGLRATVLAIAPGSWVEVSGALRRRFYRGAGGLGSRYEVETDAVEVLVAAPTEEQSAASEIS